MSHGNKSRRGSPVMQSYVAPRQHRRNPDYGGAMFTAFETETPRTMVIFGGHERDVRSYLKSPQAKELSRVLRFRIRDDPWFNEDPQTVAYGVYPGGYTARLFYVVPGTMQLVEQPFIGKRDDSYDQWKDWQAKMEDPNSRERRELKSAISQIEKSRVLRFGTFRAKRGSKEVLVILGGEPSEMQSHWTTLHFLRFARTVGIDPSHASFWDESPEKASARVSPEIERELYVLNNGSFQRVSHVFAGTGVNAPMQQKQKRDQYLYALHTLNEGKYKAHILIYALSSEIYGPQGHIIQAMMLALFHPWSIRFWEPGDYAELVTRTREFSERDGYPPMEAIITAGGIHVYPLGRRPTT